MHHQVDTLGIVLSLNFRGLHKNKLPKVIEIDALVIFEAQNDTFLIKRLPKSPRFEKKYSQFYLLDRQVDILSIILSSKSCMWNEN